MNLFMSLFVLLKSTWFKFIRPVVGLVLIGVGFFTAPTPLPIGIPLIIFGIIILGKNDPRVQWLFVQVKRLLNRGARSPFSMIKSISCKFLTLMRQIEQGVQEKTPQDKDDAARPDPDRDVD